MRAVVQRVSTARVTVSGRLVGTIGAGLLVLLGIATDDTAAETDWLLDKLLDLRIFENQDGKFDKSLRDIHGELLLVSQFTLLADTRKGRRPSFTAAARPEHAIPLYEHAAQRARAQGITVATGEFGAHMAVELVNDGPVTIVLDSKER
ncbi:MAG: D-aminoacyl-tRNA deacylase [Candidatus Binatia bacterium]